MSGLKRALNLWTRLLVACVAFALAFAPLAADAHMRSMTAVPHAMHAAAPAADYADDHAKHTAHTEDVAAIAHHTGDYDPGCCTTYCHVAAILGMPLPFAQSQPKAALEPSVASPIRAAHPWRIERPPSRA